jgi:hypothetical protein
MGSLAVLAILGLGALLFLSGEKNGEAPNGTKPGGLKYDGCFDTGIPLEMKIELNKLLDTAVDPGDLELAAGAADQNGWPLLAACLRKKAAALRGQTI